MGITRVGQSSSYRQVLGHKSILRPALILVLLVCFAVLQTASVIDNYSHGHEGSHTHCCPACHSGHLPVALVIANFKVAPQIVSEYTQWPEDAHLSAETLAASSLS